ncbi:YoaK family protein [Kribbella lupini]|uniref:YoaK family protein n=1 Tax=Kribbella lupini TaxID=291602 RepID=A0ABP4NCG4_9ACTN
MAREAVHVVAMLVLTFSTGVADAVRYLGLDRVFTGNMTGNVVILGMGVSGTTDLPVGGPLIALAAFMAGASLGGRVTRTAAPDSWRLTSTVLLCGVGLVFTIAALILAVEDVEQGTALAFTLTALLAAAMGLQAAVARHIAVKDVTTVVVTSTITGLAADSRFGAALENHPWLRRSAAVLLIAAGAGAGAAILTVSLALAVAVPAVLTFAVAVVGGGMSSRSAT